MDVKNPTMPTAEVVQLHIVKPQVIVPRLRMIYPGAHIELAGQSNLLIRIRPQDMTPPFGSSYRQIYRLHNVDAASVDDLVSRTY